MFTLPQIKAAHSKVKSGADFPRYMQDLADLGVTSYETFVYDNHTDYYGKDDYKISSEGRAQLLEVADKGNVEQFQSDLKSHQQGHTDYPTFLEDCAQSGIEKWIVKMDRKTCSYYDKSGNEILVEKIPEP